MELCAFTSLAPAVSSCCYDQFHFPFIETFILMYMIKVNVGINESKSIYLSAPKNYSYIRELLLLKTIKFHSLSFLPEIFYKLLVN